MAFKKTATIKLTPAQHRFFREEIAAAVALGDRRERGFTLEFDDYEGARSTLSLFMRVRWCATTRDYRTWTSVIDRLDAAIRDAVKA